MPRLDHRQHQHEMLRPYLVVIFAKRKRLRISQRCLQLTSQFIQAHCYIPPQYDALKTWATQSAANTVVIGVNGEFFNIESV